MFTITGCGKKEIEQNETKLFESFLGKYKISYNTEVDNDELKHFTFVDEFDLSKKCYGTDAGSISEQEVITENCIDAVDFETIHNYGDHWGLVYKIDDSSAVLRLTFYYVAEPSWDCDIGVEKNAFCGWNDMRMKSICFKKDDEDNLVQTDCVTRKNSWSSTDSSESIDRKYEFKLTRIQ